jgi:glycosyltransferase involved in cell wall biosynthesis
MSDKPLVSVMMPAYNSGKTIVFALASLVAQTYANWECVVVDDGSADDTAARAHSVLDPRIRIIRLEENMGEAAARQRALEACRGELLAMLDADDWSYPDRLEMQVGSLSSNRDVFLVSCGMAIVGLNGDILGVRAEGLGRIAVLDSPVRIPVAHAPSMLRLEGIAGTAYDQQMRMASDSDFMRRILFNKKYVILPYVGYCYRELESASLRKTVAGYYYNTRGLAKFFRARPVPIGWRMILEIAKIPVFALTYPFGLFRALIKSRSRTPSQAEREDFSKAKAAVQAVYDRIVAGGVL